MEKSRVFFIKSFVLNKIHAQNENQENFRMEAIIHSILEKKTNAITTKNRILESKFTSITKNRLVFGIEIEKCRIYVYLFTKE